MAVTQRQEMDLTAGLSRCLGMNTRGLTPFTRLLEIWRFLRSGKHPQWHDLHQAPPASQIHRIPNRNPLPLDSITLPCHPPDRPTCQNGRAFRSRVGRKTPLLPQSEPLSGNLRSTLGRLDLPKQQRPTCILAFRLRKLHPPASQRLHIAMKPSKTIRLTKEQPAFIARSQSTSPKISNPNSLNLIGSATHIKRSD